MDVGDKIKSARISKGLTQEELGKLVGVQKSAIAKYETGRVINIKRSTLKALASVLEIKGSDLIESSEEKEDGNVALTVEQVRFWIVRCASKEEKAEVMTAILQSSPVEDAKELLKIYLDLLMGK